MLVDIETHPSSQRMTTFSRESSWIHKFIQLVSTHLHLRFNDQTVNAMGCFASRNNRIEIVVSVAEATSTSRIRDIPLSHEQKCILREFWQLIEPIKSVIGKKVFGR